MANLRQARRNLYAIAGVLVVVDIVAIVILLTATGTRNATLDQQYQDLRKQVQLKSRTVVPPDQVQQRVEESRKQMAAFYQERLPSEMSTLSNQLGTLAKEAGVKLASIRYDEIDSDIPGLRCIRISASIGGDYLQSVKFINAMERSKIFFVIDSVTLGDQQAGQVRLGITSETYLKGGA